MKGEEMGNSSIFNHNRHTPIVCLLWIKEKQHKESKKGRKEITEVYSKQIVKKIRLITQTENTAGIHEEVKCKYLQGETFLNRRLQLGMLLKQLMV